MTKRGGYQNRVNDHGVFEHQGADLMVTPSEEGDAEKELVMAAEMSTMMDDDAVNNAALLDCLDGHPANEEAEIRGGGAGEMRKSVCGIDKVIVAKALDGQQ